jgi:hypothetical protein
MRRIGSASSVIEGPEHQPADCAGSLPARFPWRRLLGLASDNVAGELPVFGLRGSFKWAVNCAGGGASGSGTVDELSFPKCRASGRRKSFRFEDHPREQVRDAAIITALHAVKGLSAARCLLMRRMPTIGKRQAQQVSLGRSVGSRSQVEATCGRDKVKLPSASSALVIARSSLRYLCFAPLKTARRDEGATIKAKQADDTVGCLLKLRQTAARIMGTATLGSSSMLRRYR